MRSFSENEKTKLKNLLTEGVQVKTEMDTLNEALKDTVRAVSEELDIKPAILNKAIRTAYKADIMVKKDELDEVEEILTITGRADF